MPLRRSLKMSKIFCHSSRWLELFVAFKNAYSHLIFADGIANITFLASDEVLQICAHNIKVILREVQLRINDLRHFVRQHPHGWIAFKLERLKLIRETRRAKVFTHNHVYWVVKCLVILIYSLDNIAREGMVKAPAVDSILLKFGRQHNARFDVEKVDAWLRRLASTVPQKLQGGAEGIF